MPTTRGSKQSSERSNRAVRLIELTGGDGDFEVAAHQLALYAQDDWRVNQSLTLNLGLRWDGNIGFLPDQTNNRTIQILQRLDEPRARAIAGDADALRRRTPSWTEFQPRLGFAYDIGGRNRTVVRGGYGIFYDQIFLNLTLFSIQQTRATIFQQVLTQSNTSVGVGQIPTFRFGVDPLPGAPPGPYRLSAAVGSSAQANPTSGRICCASTSNRHQTRPVGITPIGITTPCRPCTRLNSRYLKTTPLVLRGIRAQ